MIWMFIILASAQTYPDKTLTPGVVRVVSKEELCRVGSTKDARKVTQANKNEVFRRYGMIKGKFNPGDYEIDHFISLELGGANDLNNLWSQPYCKTGNDPLKTGCWGAREKDFIETALHRQICKNKISIEQAQQIIKTDWVAEYKKIKGLK
ncbi:MAG TPA: HNH endonuclease signature motif containing protein [Rhabdochlamydiaceae bacterium]